MENGTRLAIAILMMFLAMIAFFFAFHPGGVENVHNPDSALQWLMGEFDKTAGTGNSPATAAIQPANSADLTNLPGTNVGP